MVDHDEGAVNGEQSDPEQMWFRYRRYPFLLAKVSFFGAIAYGIYLALMTVDAVLFPVLVSMLIAYLLDPTIDWAEEKGMNRTVAIGILILIGTIGLALFALVLYPTFANSFSSVIERLPQVGVLIEERFIPWVEDAFGYSLPPTISETLSEYRGQIQQEIPSVAKRVTGWAGGLLSQTGAIAASVLNLVMIPLFSFYFLRDFDKMRLSLVDYIPQHRRDVIIDRISKMDTVVGAWFRGQVNVALILAVLYSIGLGSVFGFAGIGVTSGVAVGILTGLLNIIPYFGVLIGVILSTLLVLIDWAGPGPLLGVAAVFIVVQTLEGYVITPKVVGEAVGLSPVVVIIVLLLGGEVLGLMGVLLAIPVAGVVKVLLPDIFAVYRSSPFYTGHFRPDDTPAEPEPPPQVDLPEAVVEVSDDTDEGTHEETEEGQGAGTKDASDDDAEESDTADVSGADDEADGQTDVDEADEGASEGDAVEPDSASDDGSADDPEKSGAS